MAHKEETMIVKGITANGFNYEYDNEKLDDWEVADWLTEIMELSETPEEDLTADDTTTLIRDLYAVIHHVFTRKQIAAWKNTNRDEKGKVDSDKMWDDFRMIFMSGENEETKN